MAQIPANGRCTPPREQLAGLIGKCMMEHTASPASATGRYGARTCAQRPPRRGGNDNQEESR